MARYKVLKSVAHSTGHSFTSLMNYRGDDYVMGHLLRRAREVRDATLRIDLLTGSAAPGSLLTPEVRESVQSYVRWLPQLVASHRTDMRYVRAAHMTISFDLSVERPARYAPDCIESPYVCRVVIQDDRGKEWSAEIRDWWFPEPTAGLPRRARSGLVRVIVRLGQIIRTVWARESLRGAAA
jgi:hypothetical protein